MRAGRISRLPHSRPTTEVLGGMRVGRMFRPRGRRPRTPARGRRPWTPRSLFHGQRGSPPVTPPKALSRPIMTRDTGEGGPRLPIPAIQVKADRGRRWFLRRTESRPTVARPSASPGQPSFVLPPLPANLLSSFRHSRPTFTRPSTTHGQPSLVLPPLQVNRRSDHTYSDPRDTYVRWGSRGRPPRR